MWNTLIFILQIKPHLKNMVKHEHLIFTEKVLVWSFLRRPVYRVSVFEDEFKVVNESVLEPKLSASSCLMVFHEVQFGRD